MRPKSLLTWYWLVAGTIAAVAVGWLAAQINLSPRAPLGLTSVAVGATLGATLAYLAATLRVAGLYSLLLGTVLLAIVLVVAEHTWLYRDFRGQWREAREKSAAVAMFRDENPPSPQVYFSREFNGPLWTFDALAIVGAAVGVVFVWQRNRQ